MITQDIHKGGRPKRVIPPNILQEYETMTTRQLGLQYGVARSTISRWLKVARQEVNDVASEAQS